MIVMQYANNGSLLSYLHQNINNLTWRDKLLHLKNIALYLYYIHSEGLVHGGNIVLHNDQPSEFIAPEVFVPIKFFLQQEFFILISFFYQCSAFSFITLNERAVILVLSFC